MNIVCTIAYASFHCQIINLHFHVSDVFLMTNVALVYSAFFKSYLKMLLSFKVCFKHAVFRAQ